MEPESSLPHSQVSATCPYPGPAQSSPHTHIPPPGPLHLVRTFKLSAAIPLFPLYTSWSVKEKLHVFVSV